MEGTVGDAEVGFRIMAVRIFAVTLEQGQGCNEVPLLQEVRSIWQFKLFLYTEIWLLVIKAAY